MIAASALVLPPILSAGRVQAGASGAECTNPVFETSDRNGGWSNGGYYVHNNMWNSEYGLGPETLYACSFHDWYVVSNQTNNAGAVKTYPNVHKNYDQVPISSFPHLWSSFAATTPHVGIYNVAYDIWINGIAKPGGAEVMIWTENYKQVPGGSKVATATFGGRVFDVWKANWGWTYIALVPAVPVASGSLDLLEMLNWIISKGWIPSTSTVNQIGFGVEIVSTNGADATFKITDFSINTTKPSGVARRTGLKPPVAGYEYYSISGKRLRPGTGMTPARNRLRR